MAFASFTRIFPFDFAHSLASASLRRTRFPAEAVQNGENNGLTPCLGRSTPIENIGVSAAPPKPSGPPDPEKEIAARLGEAGGEDYEKALASNLPLKEYALARLDAIANFVDPHLADLDALDALIWLADAVMFGEARS